MPIVLSDILTPTEAQVLDEAAQALSFEDGSRTAGRVAGTVKHNLQAAPGRDRDALLDKVKAALLAHPLFQAVAYLRSFAGMVLSRTEGGGEYGPHIDNALMAGGRSDISFTVFLSPPESYEGGALCVTDRVEERSFKLGQGEALRRTAAVGGPEDLAPGDHHQLLAVVNLLPREVVVIFHSRNDLSPQ